MCIRDSDDHAAHCVVQRSLPRRDDDTDVRIVLNRFQIDRAGQDFLAEIRIVLIFNIAVVFFDDRAQRFFRKRRSRSARRSLGRLRQFR